MILKINYKKIWTTQQHSAKASAAGFYERILPQSNDTILLAARGHAKIL